MTGPSRRIRVVVADDHPVYREGIVRALNLSGDIDVVAEVADGRAALTAIRELRPAVALLDYKMPCLDGLDVVRGVMRDGLPTSVVVLSAFDDTSLVNKALAEGAAGYLTKESDRHEIVTAVIKCAEGGRYVPPQLAGCLSDQVNQSGGAEAAD
jgi:two-component system, NarL family, nitrate/nitrite response regulator NarL